MSSALKMPPRMTVAEFLEWEPDDKSGALWQLRDGEPEMMVPASDPHGSIQSELAYLITAHLRATGRSCRASPSNVSRTRANVRAYKTIPTVAEIVVLRSTAIAAAPNGEWPQQPDIIAADGELRLDSIDFAMPLREAYRTTSLA